MPARQPSVNGVNSGRFLIIESHSEAFPTSPHSGLVGGAPFDSSRLNGETLPTHTRATQAPLEEFVSGCLAQLRQVMDGLQ